MTDRTLLIGPSEESVDCEDDDEDVLNFRFEYETDDQGFWLTDVDPSLSVFTCADVVTIDIHEDTDEGLSALSAGLRLTPAEAQRLGRQLIRAGENAEEERVTDVRL
jgi:hypothetical protein